MIWNQEAGAQAGIEPARTSPTGLLRMQYIERPTSLRRAPAHSRLNGRSGEEGAGRLDLNPSDEQQLLVETFGALDAKESSPEDVRAAESSGHDHALGSKSTTIGCWRWSST